MTRKILSRLSEAKFLLIAVLACFIVANPAVASLNSQINQLEQQKAQQQAQVNATQSQVNTLQGQLSALNAQLSSLQGQISSTQSKISATQALIAQKEAELATEKAQLDELIRVSYENASQSTFEMILNSNSLSDFFNQQEYSDSIQSKINAASAAVEAAKKVLEQQNAQLAAQKTDLQGQESLVAQAQANQAELVAETQGQEANYQSILNGTTSQLNGLYAQRAALDAANGSTVVTGGTGGYPSRWAGASPDSLVDDWFYYNRECVSYVAFRRALDGKPTSGYGNAGSWMSHTNSSSPAPGAVAVWSYNAVPGGFGHVAYVESVNGDGSITVAEYNWTPYSFDRRTIHPGGGWPSGFIR
jgi:surface antigen